jgi:HEPN superfamily protein
LKQFLADARLKPHQTSRSEVGDLLRVADRDLKDAAVKAISLDLRFTTAYQAALQLATIVLTASGYRTTGVGHHWITFNVLPDLMGPEYQDQADYFDQCRNKRNRSDYDRAGTVSATEAAEILIEAKRFRISVLNWLKARHPDIAP